MLSSVKTDLDSKVKKFLSQFTGTVFAYIPDHDSTLPVIHSELLDLSRQSQGYGIFLSVNGFSGGKRDSAHLTSLNALFCDIDYPDKTNRDPDKIRMYKNELVQELYDMDFLPTHIVETKNGLHVYWFFKQPIFLAEYNEQQRDLLLSNYRKVEEAILTRFEGDPNAKDTARVLRVPGTLHQKDPKDPFEIKLIHSNEEMTYTFDQLAQRFLIQEPEDVWAVANAENAIDESVKKEIERLYPKLERPSYQKLLSKTAPIPEGHRNRALLVAATACCQSGWPLDKTLAHFNEFHGLSVREIRKTILSAYRTPYDFGTRNEVMQTLMTQEERVKLSEVSSKAVGKKFKEERDLDKHKQEELFLTYERVLADRFPTLKYKHNNDFYDYKDGLYRPITDDEMQSRILREMEADGLLKYRKISSVKDKVACFKSIEGRCFFHEDENPNPNILNLKNGLLDITTFQLSPHTPNYLSTTQTPIEYSPGAKCPLWNRFLNEIMEGDTDQITLLQEIAGYCLTNETSFQKAFILLGHQGGNGKGVFTHTISKLLGRENVTNLKLTTITRQFGLYGLIGKRLNVIDEISGNYFESDVIKSLIGGQDMTAEVKFRPEPIEFKPITKLIFTINELPKINDTTQALYRRFIIVLFNHTFQNNPDYNLEEKLEKELPGILLWAIEGLKKLRADGKFLLTEKNYKAMNMFKSENSPLIEFLVTAYTPAPVGYETRYSVGVQELYTQYKQYCQDSGYKPKSLANFVREISHTVFENWCITRGDGANKNSFYGLRPTKTLSGNSIQYDV